MTALASNNPFFRSLSTPHITEKKVSSGSVLSASTSTPRTAAPSSSSAPSSPSAPVSPALAQLKDAKPKARNSFYDRDKNFIDSITLDMAGVTPEQLGLGDLPTNHGNISPRKKTIYKTVRERSSPKKDKKDEKSPSGSPSASPIGSPTVSPDSKSKWKDALFTVRKKKEHKKKVKENPTMELMEAAKVDSIITDALNYRFDDLNIGNEPIPQPPGSNADYGKVETMQKQESTDDKEKFLRECLGGRRGTSAN